MAQATKGPRLNSVFEDQALVKVPLPGAMKATSSKWRVKLSECWCSESGVQRALSEQDDDAASGFEPEPDADGDCKLAFTAQAISSRSIQSG